MSGNFNQECSRSAAHVTSRGPDSCGCVQFIMAANSSNSTSGKSGGKQSTPSAEQVTAHRLYYSNTWTRYLHLYPHCDATKPELNRFNKQQSRTARRPSVSMMEECRFCCKTLNEKRVYMFIFVHKALQTSYQADYRDCRFIKLLLLCWTSPPCCLYMETASCTFLSLFLSWRRRNHEWHYWSHYGTT